MKSTTWLRVPSTCTPTTPPKSTLPSAADRRTWFGAAPAVTARSLPATSGVRSEAQTVLAAPAEEVATMLADPRNFVPLFPAHAVDVLTSAADLQVVAVEMRKPWPVGSYQLILNRCAAASLPARPHSAVVMLRLLTPMAGCC